MVAALAVLIFVRNYRVLFRYTYLSGLIGVLLLLLPFVPGLGTDQNADVWVSLGFVSFHRVSWRRSAWRSSSPVTSCARAKASPPPARASFS